MTSAPILLMLSGPNLNLLGERDPAVYGTTTLAELVEAVEAEAARHSLVVEHLQTNHEGGLVDAIHNARGRVSAIIINPGAFTHYAWSIHDALDTFDGPVIEVHLSDPKQRESWRHLSVVEPVADATIAGHGAAGYPMAVAAAAALLAE